MIPRGTFWLTLLIWVAATIGLAALILGCQTATARKDYCAKEDARGRCIEWRFTPAKRK